MECTVTLLWEIQDSPGKRWSRREENRICFATELIEVYGGTGRQWCALVELKGQHLYGPDCSSVSSWETLLAATTSLLAPRCSKDVSI